MRLATSAGLGSRSNAVRWNVEAICQTTRTVTAPSSEYAAAFRRVLAVFRAMSASVVVEAENSRSVVSAATGPPIYRSDRRGSLRQQAGLFAGCRVDASVQRLLLIRRDEPGVTQELGHTRFSLDPILREVDGINELIELVRVPVLEVGKLLIVLVPEVIGVRLEDRILVRRPFVQSALPDGEEERDLGDVIVVPALQHDE